MKCNLCDKRQADKETGVCQPCMNRTSREFDRNMKAINILKRSIQHLNAAKKPAFYFDLAHDFNTNEFGAVSESITLLNGMIDFLCEL